MDQYIVLRYNAGESSYVVVQIRLETPVKNCRVPHIHTHRMESIQHTKKKLINQRNCDKISVFEICIFSGLISLSWWRSFWFRCYCRYSMAKTLVNFHLLNSQATDIFVDMFECVCVALAVQNLY